MGYVRINYLLKVRALFSTEQGVFYRDVRITPHKAYEEESF
jgi:hypothetical protein